MVGVVGVNERLANEGPIELIGTCHATPAMACRPSGQACPVSLGVVLLHIGCNSALPLPCDAGGSHCAGAEGGIRQPAARAARP